MTKITPLNDRVLVKRAKAKVTQGGIILPDSAQEKPKEGEVVAVGPGAQGEQHTPMTVAVGDRVLFSAYAGTEVAGSSDEEEYLIMSEDDILGVLV